MNRRRADRGQVLAIVVFVAVLALTDAVSLPNDQFGAAFEPVGLVLSLFVAGVVALAAPSLAVVCATYGVRRGDPLAQRAVTASWVAFALAFVVDGSPGILLWGPVLFIVLKREKSSPPAGAEQRR